MRPALLFMLLLPGAAWADPISAIGLLASAWASSGAVIAGLTLSATAAFAINIGLGVLGTVSARRKAKKAASAQRAAANATLQDRSVTVLRGDPPWQVVYGRAIVGGAIVDIFTTDKTVRNEDGSTYSKADALKHLVIVLAAHECRAINDVYIDGVAVGTLDGSGYPTGGDFAVTRSATRTVSFTTSTTPAEQPVSVLNAYSSTGSGIDEALTAETVTISGASLNGPAGVPVVCNYTVADNLSSVRIQKQLGSTTQTTNAYLASIAASRYTANHRLRGLCYIVVTLDLEDARFQGGPPNITADVSGKTVYDTRIAGNAVGDDNANPALCVRDFLVSAYGFGAASTDIDETYCNAAANACDANISLVVGATTTTGQDTYSCNGSFTTDQGAEAVLEDLAECMAGTVVYGAKWQISAGAWTAPVMTLTDDDLNGAIEVLQADTSTEDLFNGVRGQLVLRGAQTPSDFNPYQNSTFVTADGKALWTNVTLPFTDDLARARNLCRVFVEANRSGQVIRYPAKLRAWVLQVGDRVTVTSAEYGFSAKTYRVTDWQFDVTAPVVLTLQEDDASIYDLADAAVADPTPNTDLPNPFIVAALTSLAALSDDTTAVRGADGNYSPRVRVSWTAVTNALVLDGGRIEILWRRNSDAAWRIVRALGSDTSASITGVREGDRLVIVGVAINKYEARSVRAIIAHTVSGKSTVPDDVSGLANSINGSDVTISWTANSENDYAYTELRYGSGWTGGTFIWRGKASSMVWKPGASATYTVRARHFDTSGNSSATTATTSVVFTDPEVAPVPFGVTVDSLQLISSGLSANSYVRLNVDGTIDKQVNSGGYTSAGSWYEPTGGTPGNDFRVRVTLSGDTLQSGTVDAWEALSTARTWNLRQATSGSYADKRANLTFTIAATGDDTPLATGTAFMWAVVEP